MHTSALKFLFVVFVTLSFNAANAIETVCIRDESGKVVSCNNIQFNQNQIDDYDLCIRGGASQGLTASDCFTAVTSPEVAGEEEGRGRAGPGGARASASEDTQVQCEDALKKTKKQCTGAEWSQYSAAAIQTATTVMSLINAGKTKDACEAAQKLNGFGALSNAAVSAYCYKAISSCKKTCDPKKDNPEAAGQCDAFNEHAGLAGKQAVENATAYAGSAACANAAAGKCIGQEAYNDEECTQFCMKPGRQEHPKCKLALNNCSNAAYAAQNVQYCTCLSNPLSPSCRANAGTPVPGSGNPSGLNLDDDGIGGADYDFNGVDAQGKAANTNSGDGGGGGFNAGGGGSSAFGDSGGGGSGDEPLNKEILTGTGGAAGAGGGFFGGGGYGEGNSAKGGSKSGEDKGIDLSAFLPGGKQDPTRNPASAGYGDPTITKANGLTNWQKVTRKLNEKRPELMP
ncbi:MAG: hypothetical protein V4596_09835 [Bdellovibrionota bacterium]